MSWTKACVARTTIVGLLFAGVGVASPPDEGAQPPCEDAVLDEGAGLDSTADERQRQLIHRLVRESAQARALADVTIDYPLTESIFPPEMIAPTFLWHDAAGGADRWLVEVALAQGSARLYILVPGISPPEGRIDPMALSSTNEIYQPTPYQASAKAWKPCAPVWEAVKRASVDRPAKVTLFGYRGDGAEKVLSRGEMSLSTSPDPVGAPIFYRDVPLMPPPEAKQAIMPLTKGALPLINWRLRDISRPESRLMLRDMPSCANCHSFSADGKTLGMDIDGPRGDKGAYAISRIAKQMVIGTEDVISWNTFEHKPDGHKTLGFLSRLSPDGQYAVTTLNESIYVANFRDYKFGQVFYPTRGILAYYSRATGAMKALPGADDPEYVHTDAVWTPDGKTIVFARGRACDPYSDDRPLATYAGDPNETPMRYDLYRIPFNGGRGGVAVPIAGASANGMSNNFPKVSPDGKWIVFVRCKNGQLMRPDSKLWIVPIDGGEARLMRSNTSLMNSWHSFSPNGRWMVFSSKSNTPYTQMFLTHIDEEGNDSPAVLIENSTAANRAVNIPEFVNISYEEFASIYVAAVEHYRHYDRGIELAGEGRLAEAAAELEKAVEQEAYDSRLHTTLSQILLQLGQHERALKHTRESLRINPYNYEMQSNLGFLLVEKGLYDEARRHLDLAIRIYPKHAGTLYNRATLHLRLENHDDALTDYTEALRLEPRYTKALNGRGILLRTMGDLTGALDDFNRSIQLAPQDPTPWYFRALIRKETGDLTGALHDSDKALEVVAPNSRQSVEVNTLRRQILASLGEGS